MKTVYLGMSGGVDSSVSVLRLKEQGYDVVGAYMKNWSRDLPGFQCPWQEDYQDAKRVAVSLGIKFTMFDFEAEYQSLVVDYMLDEYRAGRTPNPDIMCNQEIKFRLFKDAAEKEGAELIATGHYAQTKNGKLFTAVDEKKDQTYFLYRVSCEALHKTVFPIGDLTKNQVRRLAELHHLATAAKRESMGICFVGNVGIKDFLKEFVETESGPIVDQHGVQVGEHDGAIFYTIGQRHGLHAGGGRPYYVTGKDMASNTVHVTTKLNDPKLWQKELNLHSSHWITTQPESAEGLLVRFRHLGALQEVEDITVSENGHTTLRLKEDVRAIAAGQSAVLYRADEVLGGGILG